MRKDRKHKPQRPPLPCIDRVGYGICMGIALVFVGMLPVATLVLRQTITFADADVLAAYSRASILWMLPLMLFLLVSLGAWTSGRLHARVPLFRRVPTRAMRPREARLRRMAIGAWCVALLVCMLLYPLSLFGRVELTATGEVVRYNALGMEMLREEAKVAKISRVSLGGGRFSARREDYALAVVTRSGWTCSFTGRDFRDDLRGDADAIGDALSLAQGQVDVLREMIAEFSGIS